MGRAQGGLGGARRVRGGIARCLGIPVAIIAAAALLAPAASAVVVRTAGGQRLGVTRQHVAGAVRSNATQSSPTAAGNIDYQGGPVVHSSAPYLIFWNPSGNSALTAWEPLLERFFTDAAAESGQATNVYAVDRQYADSTGFAAESTSFSTSSQAIVDTHAYPSTQSGCSDAGGTACVMDGQVQAEVERLISADHLPNDGTSDASFPQDAAIYIVVLPPTTNECYNAGDCADSDFCSYHSSFLDGHDEVLYAAIPTLILATDPKACQDDGNNAVQEPNGSLGDVVVKYLSHEDTETITDPLLNAWISSSTGNEVADNCNQYGPQLDPTAGADPNAFTPYLGGSAAAGTLFNQRINGDDYYLQSVWSDGDEACELTPSAGTLTPAFSVPAGPRSASAALSFSPSASTSTAGFSSETWSFGDGSTSFEPETTPSAVSHTYASAGDYTVTLTLVDGNGNVATVSHEITVGESPTAAFSSSSSPNPPLAGTPVSFDGTSSLGPISSYSWEFGDGTTGSGATPTHAYAQPGSYLVSLTVTNGQGVADTITHQVVVADQPPTASLVVDTASPIAGQPTTFDGSSSSDPDSQIASYAWSFGDGATGAGATVQHTYAGPGTYTVTLRVTDGYGTASSSSRQIIVHALPAATFTNAPADPLARSPVSFNASGTTDSESGVRITGYSWGFGDGSTATGPLATHSYAAAGAYTVALTVTNSLGLSERITRLVNVVGPPHAGFVVKTAHPVTGQPTVVASSSAASAGTIVAYSWSFGDGTGAVGGASPRHVYAKAGTYRVTLTVTDSYGHTATATSRLAVALAGRITRVAVSRTRAGTVLVITVNEAGRVSVAGRTIALSKAGTARFVLKLTAAEAHTLNSTKRLTLHVQVHFTPHAGPRQSRAVAVTLRT